MALSKELQERLDDIAAKMKDEDYWPPAASAEEELTFAMIVRVGSSSITGRSLAEIRSDLIQEEKHRRLVWPMHPATRNRTRSNHCGEHQSLSEVTPPSHLSCADSGASIHQALLENPDAQSPVCTNGLPNNQRGCDQSQCRAQERL